MVLVIWYIVSFRQDRTDRLVDYQNRTNEAECTAKLQAGHDKEVTQPRFAGQPRGLLIGKPPEASVRLVDVRPAYSWRFSADASREVTRRSDRITAGASLL